MRTKTLMKNMYFNYALIITNVRERERERERERGKERDKTNDDVLINF